MKKTIEVLFQSKPVLDIDSISKQLLSSNAISNDQGTMLIDLDEIRFRYRILQALLPKCKLHYAVKSCPLPGILSALKKEGASFDIASKHELKLVMDQGGTIDHCMHTHPIKSTTEIMGTYGLGVRCYVVDSFNELSKFSSLKNEVKFLLRLSFQNDIAAFDLSKKFGVLPKYVLEFLEKAYDMGFNIEGLSFHVGSQMTSNSMYLHALQTCAEIFKEAEKLGIKLNKINIGGGFPFHEEVNPQGMCDFFEPISQFLDTHFADKTCIAEPGRFICASAGHLLLQVIGKAQRENQILYYLNDGLYGCLSSIIVDIYDAKSKIQPLVSPQQSKKLCTVFGPTCDSIDTIAKDIYLPELFLDDMVYFGNCGAYSVGNTTQFNGLQPSKVIYINKQ